MMKRGTPAHNCYRLPLAVRRKKIALIGGGKMGQAILRGMLKAGMPIAHLLVAEPNAGVRRQLKKIGRVPVMDGPKAVGDADVVILAVKPQMLLAVLQDLKPALRKDALVVSIAAGITLRLLQRELPRRPVVRVMPNLPATVGKGFTALTIGNKCSTAQGKCAQALFEAVGQTVIVAEKHLDAITAVSGSGPAYLFVFADAWHKAARQSGLPASIADAAVRQTLEGALALMQQSDLPPATLAQHVASKGGTTEAALRVLKVRKFSVTLEKAVAAAARRSKELER